MTEYQTLKAQFEQALSQQKKKKNQVSLVRLLLFALAAFSIYTFIEKDDLIWLIPSGVFGLAFAVFLNIYYRISATIQLLQERIQTCDLIALDEVEDEFAAENQHHKAVFTDDLDILGPNSLFNILNKTRGFSGNGQLKTMLANPLVQQEAIYARQEAVQELAKKQAFTIEFLTFSKRMAIDRAVMFNRVERAFNRPKLTYIPIAFSAINILAIVVFLVADFPQPIPALYFLSITVIAAIFRFTQRKKLAQVKQFTTLKAEKLADLHTIFALIEKEPFSASLNSTLQEKLKNTESTASQTIKNITAIKETLDAGTMPMMGFALNALFMWDIYFAMKFEDAIQAVDEPLVDWLDQYASLEAMLSLGIFNYKNPTFITPNLVAKPCVFKATGLYHPLLKGDHVVSNDFGTENKNSIAIITGANMAGKSTFLRAVGVNLVLAMNGVNVSAQHFSFYPMQLFTSIRTSDNLSSGDSYFKNEINKLRVLIDHLDQTIPHYIILDEILKGTNSQDKLIGSQKFLEKVMRMKTDSVCFIATHDLELTKMQDQFPHHITNYCFELRNVDENYYSDYKLRPGTTKVMNAIYLMEKYGIIDA